MAREGRVREESTKADKWVTLSVRPPALFEEALTNFLVEQTSRGVRLDGNRVTAYCRQGDEALRCLRELTQYYRALQDMHPGLPELEVVQEDLESEDWGEAWKTFFKPVNVGKTIVVKPTWESYQPSAGQLIIEIDPGRAFGTGNHPTTALCIEMLEHRIHDLDSSRAPSVLDVGTGTGILAIVAARLGAGRVIGLDIDPQALEIAAQNMVLNGVAETVSVSSTPLDRMEGTFDVVVANLTAEHVIRMAVLLARRVATGGLLLLSGILAERLEETVDIFQSHHLVLVEQRVREEWRAILFQKEEVVQTSQRETRGRTAAGEDRE